MPFHWTHYMGYICFTHLPCATLSTLLSISAKSKPLDQACELPELKMSSNTVKKWSRYERFTPNPFRFSWAPIILTKSSSLSISVVVAKNSIIGYAEVPTMQLPYTVLRLSVNANRRCRSTVRWFTYAAKTDPRKTQSREAVYVKANLYFLFWFRQHLSGYHEG